MNFHQFSNFLRQSFFDWTSQTFQEMATLLNFPDIPGMPVTLTPELHKRYFWTEKLKSQLPERTLRFPPETHPNNYWEILLGDYPKISCVNRIFYESPEDGYFSFYIENYKNLRFLPNDMSEFLQIHCHFCLDIQFLEVCRETLFVMVVLYYYMVSLRLFLTWIITINPYTIPICYFIALTDWFEDYIGGYLPLFFGVNVSTPLFLTAIGMFADSLNHLVFTMPFLPSEGNPGMMTIDGEVKHVLRYQHLPILWYKYPIPNEIREFWYTERPDILEYLSKAYAELDIQFLPDRMIIKPELDHSKPSGKKIAPSIDPPKSDQEIGPSIDPSKSDQEIVPSIDPSKSDQEIVPSIDLPESYENFVASDGNFVKSNSMSHDQVLVNHTVIPHDQVLVNHTVIPHDQVLVNHTVIPHDQVLVNHTVMPYNNTILHHDYISILHYDYNTILHHDYISIPDNINIIYNYLDYASHFIDALDKLI